jgi:flagellar biosynthesis protein FliQ
MQKSKKGMQWLSGVAYAVVALVMIVGIGITVLSKLADSVGTGAANTSINYGITQLGSSGLLSWLPAIIALVIGLFFLASFMGKKQQY